MRCNAQLSLSTPLITSSLQQTAGVRLKYSPQQTMKIAQELYEGVGGSGLITYMRTDAITLSPEFVQETRSWLRENHPEALPDQPPSFRQKADAQGAHEAIRPTTPLAVAIVHWIIPVSKAGKTAIGGIRRIRERK